MILVKTHAFGNDFLLAEEAEVPHAADVPALARAVCDRHRGIGADGLILFARTPGGASMRLLNADGSHSEISGNGVRCLAAWLAARDAGLGGVVDDRHRGRAERLERLAPRRPSLDVPRGDGGRRRSLASRSRQRASMWRPSPFASAIRSASSSAK